VSQQNDPITSYGFTLNADGFNCDLDQGVFKIPQGISQLAIHVMNPYEDYDLVLGFDYTTFPLPISSQAWELLRMKIATFFIVDVAKLDPKQGKLLFSEYQVISQQKSPFVLSVSAQWINRVQTYWADPQSLERFTIHYVRVV